MESLPDWLTPLPDAERMRAIDRWAIEVRGVPSLDLMERAGAGVARAVERLGPDGPVAVVCGGGNNGGDGFVVARLLRDAGREVTVVCASPPEELTGDALRNFERLPGRARRSRTGDGCASAKRAIVVDALLGTGFAGEPRGAVGEAIEAIDRCRGAGRQRGCAIAAWTPPRASSPGSRCVRAVTVTFHTAKPGLWIHPGKAHAGEVEVLDIGIPRGAPPRTPRSA